MAGKKPSQDLTPSSKSSEFDGAAARPASAPATRVLPHRQGLHNPRVSSATQPSDSTRSSSANGQQRRGPEKQPVLLPDGGSGQSREQALMRQAAELQPSSPRGAKPRGGSSEPPGSASSRPTSGSKRLTCSGRNFHIPLPCCNSVNTRCTCFAGISAHFPVWVAQGQSTSAHDTDQSHAAP